jgi:hypothetical protein
MTCEEARSLWWESTENVDLRLEADRHIDQCLDCRKYHQQRVDRIAEENKKRRNREVDEAAIAKEREARRAEMLKDYSGEDEDDLETTTPREPV